MWVTKLNLVQFTPVLALYDPFGVDVPLNFDITHSLNLVHKPTKTARVCHRHLKFLVVDPKYKIAPHLYPRVVYRVTPEAYPSKFPHKREAPERKQSVKGRNKQERQRGMQPHNLVNHVNTHIQL